MRTVSIIIPCYNEEKTIQLLLESILKQTFPTEQMEVVIADGLSEDNTLLKIQEFQNAHPDLIIKVVDNQKQIIPAALNAAISAAEGEIIIRLDAHSHPNAEYVETTIANLEAGLGNNVGGVWDIRPLNDSWIAASIARAAAHPFGVGGAQYRHTDYAQEVDTVPFGGFRKSLIDEIGGFDETLLTNEDYEFNTRIRKSGRKIWLDPKIRSVYYSRPNLRELAKQYWRYGYWKVKMLSRYPETIRWRQALPPLLVLSLLGLLFLSFFNFIACCLLVLEMVSYITILMAAGIQTSIIDKKLS
ncbi:MAG: glycosyltransferase family 2 protein, partial [Anaerolineales bacterium]|nr:glycosyltransferase family 2 protein [Anaerolineales bacterium]